MARIKQEEVGREQNCYGVEAGDSASKCVLVRHALRLER